MCKIYPSLFFQNFTAHQLIDIAIGKSTDTLSLQQTYELCPILLQQVLERLSTYVQDLKMESIITPSDKLAEGFINRGPKHTIIHATPMQSKSHRE